MVALFWVITMNIDLKISNPLQSDFNNLHEEEYFPIREINLSQPKNPSNGTDFGILFHTSNIVSLRLGPYLKGECMN